MTTPFDKPLYGFRFAQTNRGDTLKLVAARELGDASRWYELIAINDLVYPYLTDDQAQVRPGVLLTGQQLLVPAPIPAVQNTTDPDEVFQTDILLNNGAFQFSDGDIAVVSGRANFKQALKHRVDTEAGELIHHMSYGNRTPQLIGSVNGPTGGLLAARYTKEAVEADDRVSRVTQAAGAMVGDRIDVSVTVEPVHGQAETVNSSF